MSLARESIEGKQSLLTHISQTYFEVMAKQMTCYGFFQLLSNRPGEEGYILPTATDSKQEFVTEASLHIPKYTQRAVLRIYFVLYYLSQIWGDLVVMVKFGLDGRSQEPNRQN